MKKIIPLLIVSALLFAFWSQVSPSTSRAAAPEAALLFDDFNYTAAQDPQLNENGWTVRTAEGWPGVPGAIWDGDGVSFLDDPALEGNRLAQMTATTDGTLTTQVQLCQQRKFYEGTYASRVLFTDEPASGPDGDNVVQTFYMISPLKEALDPDYSEMDFEYLPNGGWGIPESVFFGTTWETFRPEPEWLADNTSSNVLESMAGWHTLVLQVLDNRVKYYVDGEVLGLHVGKFYPEVPMSINFNLWFIRDGQINSDEMREYIEQIDWVLFIQGEVLSPEAVEVTVDDMRDATTTFIDTVPEWTPQEPATTCDL